MLCTHKTTIFCQFGNLEICPNFANPYLTQFSSISGGNCIIYHRIYGLTRSWRPKRRPKQHANYPFRLRPPRKPNHKASLGRTYVNVCIWMPRLLMVLSAMQSPRRTTWTNIRVRNPKFFFLPGVDWCVTTVNSSLTRRRVPKPLLPFFCPTKQPINELINPCMASMQDSPRAPHQINLIPTRRSS